MFLNALKSRKNIIRKAETKCKKVSKYELDYKFTNFTRRNKVTFIKIMSYAFHSYPLKLYQSNLCKNEIFDKNRIVGKLPIPAVLKEKVFC